MHFLTFQTVESVCVSVDQLTWRSARVKSVRVKVQSQSHRCKAATALSCKPVQVRSHDPVSLTRVYELEQVQICVWVFKWFWSRITLIPTWMQPKYMKMINISNVFFHFYHLDLNLFYWFHRIGARQRLGSGLLQTRAASTRELVFLREEFRVSLPLPPRQLFRLHGGFTVQNLSLDAKLTKDHIVVFIP